jgi:ribonucleoside-diphosphate reductase alpha chain
MTLEQLKEKGEAPEWMTNESFNMISNGYLLPNETPREMYLRCASFAAQNYSSKNNYEKDFFDAMWNNWLCPASPVLSNAATQNLQISCYSGTSNDSLVDIMDHLKELAMLTKFGGGVGSSFDNLRPAGAKISKGGESSGIIPFLKMLEYTVEGIKQGSTRRGAVASYLNIEHKDAEEFIDIRNPVGDLSRKCLSVAFHNAVTISDEVMNRIIDGDKYYRNLWNKANTSRIETGENYFMFLDNANKNCPDEYKGTITQSNLCSEIMAPVNNKETFVCCLSSLNLAKYREWKHHTFKNTGLSLGELSVFFLDSVITNFINQTYNLEGLQKARLFSERHRMLGVGVLGWHTLLQQEMIPFESFQSMSLNNEIFKTLREQTYKASEALAVGFEACLVNGYRRNTALMAVAPTMSNSLISGGVSQGIEPITANIFSQKSAKGTFIKKNPTLQKLLESKGLDTSEIWEQINKDKGSVKNVKQLSEEERRVFLTAREISQYAIIQQASQRQKYIDQAQSINLFFNIPNNKEDGKLVAKYINDVHIEAWKSGIKSLYYLKTESPLKGDTVYIDKENGECLSCQG